MTAATDDDTNATVGQHHDGYAARGRKPTTLTL